MALYISDTPVFSSEKNITEIIEYFSEINSRIFGVCHSFISFRNKEIEQEDLLESVQDVQNFLKISSNHYFSLSVKQVKKMITEGEKSKNTFLGIRPDCWETVKSLLWKYELDEIKHLLLDRAYTLQFILQSDYSDAEKTKRFRETLAEIKSIATSAWIFSKAIIAVRI